MAEGALAPVKSGLASSRPYKAVLLCRSLRGALWAFLAGGTEHCAVCKVVQQLGRHSGPH